MNEQTPHGFIKIEKSVVCKLSQAKIDAIYATRKKYADELQIEESKEPVKVFFGLFSKDIRDWDKIHDYQINSKMLCEHLLVRCQNLLVLAQQETDDKYMWISDIGMRSIK